MNTNLQSCCHIIYYLLNLSWLLLILFEKVVLPSTIDDLINKNEKGKVTNQNETENNGQTQKTRQRINEDFTQEGYWVLLTLKHSSLIPRLCSPYAQFVTFELLLAKLWPEEPGQMDHELC